MKLNPDCIRDILIAAEDVITFDNWFYYSEEDPSPLRGKYTHGEIMYHIRQASDAGLINISDFCDENTAVYIQDITPYGHEFLANLRTETVWHKLKEKGTASIPILIQMAKDLALAYYQKT